MSWSELLRQVLRTLTLTEKVRSSWAKSWVCLNSCCFGLWGDEMSGAWLVAKVVLSEKDIDWLWKSQQVIRIKSFLHIWAVRNLESHSAVFLFSKSSSGLQLTWNIQRMFFQKWRFVYVTNKCSNVIIKQPLCPGDTTNRKSSTYQWFHSECSFLF